MDRALKSDPNDFECHRLLCAVHSITGKFKSAVEHGRKAFEMVPNDPRILQQYGEILLKTGQTKKGCDLTLLAMEYDPVPQGQTNADKRKCDSVFACLMDDRIDLGLELAEAIEERPASTLLYATSMAVAKTGALDGFEWLVMDLKQTERNKIEAVIDEMGNYDVVIQSTLREVFLDHIAELQPNLKLVG